MATLDSKLSEVNRKISQVASALKKSKDNEKINELEEGSVNVVDK